MIKIWDSVYIWRLPTYEYIGYQLYSLTTNWLKQSHRHTCRFIRSQKIAVLLRPIYKLQKEILITGDGKVTWEPLKILKTISPGAIHTFEKLP